MQVLEPGERPALGRCSVAVAREAEIIVLFSPSALWLSPLESQQGDAL